MPLNVTQIQETAVLPMATPSQPAGGFSELLGRSLAVDAASAASTSTRLPVHSADADAGTGTGTGTNRTLSPTAREGRHLAQLALLDGHGAAPATLAWAKPAIAAPALLPRQATSPRRADLPGAAAPSGQAPLPIQVTPDIANSAGQPGRLSGRSLGKGDQPGHPAHEAASQSAPVAKHGSSKQAVPTDQVSIPAATTAPQLPPQAGQAAPTPPKALTTTSSPGISSPGISSPGRSSSGISSSGISSSGISSSGDTVGRARASSAPRTSAPTTGAPTASTPTSSKPTASGVAGDTDDPASDDTGAPSATPPAATRTAKAGAHQAAAAGRAGERASPAAGLHLPADLAAPDSAPPRPTTGQDPVVPAVPSPGDAAPGGALGPAAASPAPNATPDGIAATPPAGQLGHALAALRTGSDGSSQLTIQLNPTELGQVHVHIVRAHDGTASVSIAVERAETLHSLQTDLGRLHQALDRAGLPEHRTVSLHLAVADAPTAARDSSFQGAPQSGSQDGSQQSGARQDRRAPAFEGGGPAPPAPAGEDPPAVTRWLRAGVNITA